jgi:hypothetical protein
MVRCIDLEPDREPVGTRVQGRPVGAKGLGEDHRCAAVQQAVRLGVAGDRHRRDQSLDPGFEQDDPHPFHQRAGFGGGQPAQQCVVAHGG